MVYMVMAEGKKKYKKNQVKIVEKKKETGCLDVPAFSIHVTLDRLLTTYKF